MTPDKIGEIALITLQRMRKAGDDPHPKTYRFLMDAFTQVREPLIVAIASIETICMRKGASEPAACIETVLEITRNALANNIKTDEQA